MSFSIGEVSALLRLAAAGGMESKALSRLLSIDILKELGGGRYLASLNGEERTVQSDVPLKEQSRFWGQLSSAQGKMAHIHTLSAKPLLLQSLAALPTQESETMLSLLKSGRLGELKAHFAEQLATAGSKEEFTALGQLLLSLQHNVLTLPLFYGHYLGFFQMKKGYNKKNKRHHVDFYAVMQHLGPVEGSLFFNEGAVKGHLRVRFESTKLFLEKHLDQLPASLHLEVQSVDTTTPLWDMSETLLDISI